MAKKADKDLANIKAMIGLFPSVLAEPMECVEVETPGGNCVAVNGQRFSLEKLFGLYDKGLLAMRFRLKYTESDAFIRRQLETEWQRQMTQARTVYVRERKGEIYLALQEVLWCLRVLCEQTWKDDKQRTAERFVQRAADVALSALEKVYEGKAGEADAMFLHHVEMECRKEKDKFKPGKTGVFMAEAKRLFGDVSAELNRQKTLPRIAFLQDAAENIAERKAFVMDSEACKPPVEITPREWEKLKEEARKRLTALLRQENAIAKDTVAGLDDAPPVPEAWIKGWEKRKGITKYQPAKNRASYVPRFLKGKSQNGKNDYCYEGVVWEIRQSEECNDLLEDMAKTKSSGNVGGRKKTHEIDSSPERMQAILECAKPLPVLEKRGDTDKSGRWLQTGEAGKTLKLTSQTLRLRRNMVSRIPVGDEGILGIDKEKMVFYLFRGAAYYLKDTLDVDSAAYKKFYENVKLKMKSK